MNEKNELFASGHDFSKLVKKAKRKSLLKNIVISLLVSSVLLTGLFGLGTYVMYQKVDKEMNYDYARHFIQGANVMIGGSLYNYTPFSASIITETSKLVGGVPVPWEVHEKVFSIFGSSRIIQSNSATGMGGVEEERIPVYFQGERMIEFYSSSGIYDSLPDDRPLLAEIGSHKNVEMAFSFDAAYSIEEVEAIFSNQANWYWVDASSPDEQEPLLGSSAYGFLSHQNPLESANGFIQQIDWLQEEKSEFQAEVKQLYEKLAADSQSSVKAENLKISGVVVTGTPEELQQFADIPIIRAAVLGVTTDRY